MDQHKLRSLVFDKTGVRIDIDDPIFALVALNEAVLEEAVGRHVALIDAASLELARQARLAGGLAHAHDGGRKPAALDATNEPAAMAAGRAAATASGAGFVDVGADAPPSAYSPTPATPVRAIATRSAAITPRELRLLAVAAGISLLSALVALGGQALFSRPAPAPTPIIQQAKSLTPEQTLALRNADKLNQAIQKLDPKTRAQLQAELQK